MNDYFDFNTADDPQPLEVIPKGELVKVHLTIKPGGYNDPNQGWEGGYATRSDQTGSVYLNCEFIVLQGVYAKRRIRSLVGLYSPKGPTWSQMGRSFIKSLINSARGLHPKDKTPQAQQQRAIRSFADLEGMVFVARVDVEQDNQGALRNVIKEAITPEHSQYAAIIGTPAPVASPGTGTASAPASVAPAPQPLPTTPAWAN